MNLGETAATAGVTVAVTLAAKALWSRIFVRRPKMNVRELRDLADVILADPRFKEVANLSRALDDVREKLSAQGGTLRGLQERVNEIAAASGFGD